MLVGYGWKMPMLVPRLAVDVHYRKENAIAAGVIITDWQSCTAEQELIT